MRDTSLESAVVGIVGIDGHPRDVAPERFEAVEVASGRCEDVHDQVEIVEQDPFGFALARGVRDAHALGAQPLLTASAIALACRVLPPLSMTK